MEVYEKRSYDVEFTLEEMQFIGKLAEFCSGIECEECPWRSFCREKVENGSFYFASLLHQIIRENEKKRCKECF